MSRASKLTLLGTSLFAASTVAFVHFQQEAEKTVRPSSMRTGHARRPPLTGQAMHQGVVRDMEQQRIKQERQLDFDMQRALELQYKQEQSVHDAIAAADAAEAKEKGKGA
ncbi:cytochrome c oxidase assembly protein [Sporothrix schenckii 1099-18]|uniref:Cytochrome c oxidase assembly protein n=1 Tax=Sporothrix schenckii 1099-18 TaxID=1397361 RepID=A0A0F2M551_SPOSC|nr:cytochrome c oxidase assembly protein [Sporothrix schenckii 1099-18]KJR84747.1 cytochrome c oxidase assembly protein [Sporothrix schenckii 1099-18]